MTAWMTGQVQVPWHRQGLFMGMHWAWWLFWIGAALAVLWAFWRLYADNRAARRELAQLREAEQELRGRHARGEIDQKQLVFGLTELLAPAAPLRPTGGTSRTTS